MYVEPSAVVAILLEEPEGDQLLAKLVQADQPIISVIGKVEATLSVGNAIRDYATAATKISEMLERLEVDVVDVPADIFDEVVKCYMRYGRGTGHAAKLNFGDCFSYAVAKRLADGLILFKGGDFSETDLIAA